MALCELPAVVVMLAGAPAALVSAKEAGVATPAAVAVTVYEPSVGLARNAGAVAMPLAFVVTVGFAANVPVAPEAGAANVTETPLTTLWAASFTTAWNGVANVLLMPAVCGVPATAVMDAAGPGRFVSENTAGAIPGCEAVTVTGPAVLPMVTLSL